MKKKEKTNDKTLIEFIFEKNKFLEIQENKTKQNKKKV